MTEENNYQENNTVEQAKEELKQEVPEIITTEVNVEGLKDLNRLVEEMEKIDAAQLEDKGKNNQCVMEHIKHVVLNEKRKFLHFN